MANKKKTSTNNKKTSSSKKKKETSVIVENKKVDQPSKIKTFFMGMRSNPKETLKLTYRFCKKFAFCLLTLS